MGVGKVNNSVKERERYKIKGKITVTKEE